MQIGSLPPRPSPREAGGGRGGKERGRGRGPGRGRRGARKRDETGPGPRGPVRERRGASAALQAASCAPGPRVCRCCRCRPPAVCAPAAPASSGRGARPAPRGARPPARAAAEPRAAFRGRTGRPRAAGRGRPAFRHRGPAWPPPLARPGAPQVRAARCTCSSAGLQPTLGQHSLRETNPSAARKASGRARCAPAACGSRRRRPTKTPASCAAAAAASPGPGPGRTGLPPRVICHPPPREPSKPHWIRNRFPVALREVKGQTASGIPGDADPGHRQL